MNVTLEIIVVDLANIDEKISINSYSFCPLISAVNIKPQVCLSTIIPLLPLRFFKESSLAMNNRGSRVLLKSFLRGELCGKNTRGGVALVPSSIKAITKSLKLTPCSWWEEHKSFDALFLESSKSFCITYKSIVRSKSIT